MVRPSPTLRALALTALGAGGAILAGSNLSPPDAPGVAARHVSPVAPVVAQGCAGKAPAPSSPPPIVIGASLGLSNGLASIGGALRNAVHVAEGQINAAGGVLGRPVRFDVKDDASDEGSGVQMIAQQFVAEGVAAVIGPIGSQQVIATQGIYAQNHVVQITPSATSTDLTTIQPTSDRWLFRTTPADDYQGAAVMLLAELTPRGLNVDGGAPQVDGGPFATCKNLALVNIDNSYGNAMGDVIEQNWPKRAGVPLVTRQKVPVELTASYAAVVRQLVSLNPQCMALISYDDVAAQFVKDLHADPGFQQLPQGFFLMGTDGVYTPGFLTNTLKNKSNPTSGSDALGTYGTNPDTQPGTSEYNEFKTIYDSYFPLNGKEAPAFAANTFDAAILLALAIQKAGTATDHVAIRNQLQQLGASTGKPYTPGQLGDALQAIQASQDVDYKGASGLCDFDPSGNVKAGFIVWEAYTTPSGTVDFRTDAHFSIDQLNPEIQ